MAGFSEGERIVSANFFCSGSSVRPVNFKVALAAKQAQEHLGRGALVFRVAQKTARSKYCTV